MTDVALYNRDKIIRQLPGDANAFEEQYISLRKKEQRIYTDAELTLLPDIFSGHIHYKEWCIRKRSSQRLINYLNKKNRPLKILEIGCGNGWLSAKLADMVGAMVTGQDINLTELKQANEVFSQKPDLNFIHADIHDKIISHSFDIIVFAASIQYFSSLKEILTTALSLLNSVGEIHILDTHFYKDEEIKDAVERTKRYYKELGHPAMSDHYFHHTIKELTSFQYQILFKQSSIVKKLSGRKDPFPWIRIIHHK